MSTFSKPAAAAGIQWEDLHGRLLLIEPKQVESGVSTAFGDKDAVRADVTVIDGPNGGEEFADALIFPGVLISQTRSLIGQMVLGRLGQGVAKPGQKPPWRLDEASEDDEKLGQRYVEHRGSKQFATPAEADAKAPWE